MFSVPPMFLECSWDMPGCSWVVPVMLLGLFTSAIQALVFATLAGAYIHEALEGHGDEHEEEHA